MDCKVIKSLLIIFFIISKSYAVEFEGKFIQGHFIVGKTDPGSLIFIDKKNVKVSKVGLFVFGIDRDRMLVVAI